MSNSDLITTNFIGDKYSGSYKYESAVLAKNGKIYCPPFGDSGAPIQPRFLKSIL